MSTNNDLVQYFDTWEQILPQDAREALRPIVAQARVELYGLPKKDLEHGAYYEGYCRNAHIARWNAERQVFVYMRSKFGERFTEEIKHPEDEKHWDVFKAQRKADPRTANILTIPLD